MFEMMTLTNLFQLFEAQKRTTRLGWDQQDLGNYISTINSINELTYGTAMYGGVDLNSYLVIPILKELVLPERVTFDSSNIAVDLVDRDISMVDMEGETYKTLSLLEFNNFTSILGNTFRKQETGLSIGSLRTEKVYTSVMASAIVDDACVLGDGNLYMPIPLTVAPYISKMYTYNCEDMQYDYLRLAMINY